MYMTIRKRWGKPNENNVIDPDALNTHRADWRIMAADYAGLADGQGTAQIGGVRYEL